MPRDIPAQVARATGRRKHTNARMGTHTLARLVKNPERAGEVEARPHTWRMLPRQFSAPSRRPTAISCRLGFRKRWGFQTTKAARAMIVRTANSVKLATRSPPGQARAASCQFLQSEKNAAQQRHATTNIAAAKGSDC